MSLLRSSQLAAIQKIGRRGMKDSVTIRRPVLVTDDSGVNEGEPTVIGTFPCWLHQSGGDQVGGIDVAAITTASTFRLNAPVGTDIRPRDYADIGDNTYVVSDTTADETWPAMLTCILRRRE